MKLNSASLCYRLTSLSKKKNSQLSTLLLLEIGFPVLPNCAAYMHYIHLPRDFRADQGTNIGPTSSGMGVNIRVHPRIPRVASHRGPAGEQIPPGAETYKP